MSIIPREESIRFHVLLRSINADLISKHAGLEELTAKILNELVSSIVVHDRRAADGIIRQSVDIHYRFISLLDDTDYAAKTLQWGENKGRGKDNIRYLRY